MLAAEFALAVAPAAGRDHTGEALVDPGGVDRDRRTEAVADHADARGIDLLARGNEGQRILGIGDLVEAAHLPALALALAAAAQIDAESAVAELLQHARLQFGMRLVLGADEAVQHDEARQPLPRATAFGNMQHAGQV